MDCPIIVMMFANDINDIGRYITWQDSQMYKHKQFASRQLKKCEYKTLVY